MTLEDDVLCWNGTFCRSVPCQHGGEPGSVLTLGSTLCQWQWPGLVSYTFFQGSTQTWFASPHPTEHTCSFGYGSIPIDTFLVGWTSINPSYDLGFTRYQGFDPSPFGLNPDVTFFGQVALTSGTPQIFDRLHKDHAHRMWVLEDSSLRKPFFFPTGYIIPAMQYTYISHIYIYIYMHIFLFNLSINQSIHPCSDGCNFNYHPWR